MKKQEDYGIICGMDFEQKQRRQKIRVLISESIMVVATIILTFAFVMVVSGYWVNGDLTVERQGFLQIYSVPRGATVHINDESWMSRTNASQMLSSGKKTVVLSRDGYDEWTKEINISEGLLYRLRYPRLFKKQRTSKEVLDVSEWLSASVSNNRKKMLLINGTLSWQLINLASSDLSSSMVDVSNVLSRADGTNLNIWWSNSNNRLLVQTMNKEWCVIDLDNNKNSINLNQKFGLDFEDVIIGNSNMSVLYAVEHGNLRRIDFSAQSISGVIAVNTTDMFQHDDKLFYISPEVGSETNSYAVYYYKSYDESTKIISVENDAKIAISKFYDEDYLFIYDDGVLSVYRGDYLSGITSAKVTIIASQQIGLVLDDFTVGKDGNFVFMRSQNDVAVLDMEEMKMTNYSISGEIGWMEDNMIYMIQDNGDLVVCDYDGYNWRTIVSEKASNQFPAIITDDAYLYYVSNNTLIRETL